MIKRNPNFELLNSHYLFSEIKLRKEQFLRSNLGISLINLGIGDTTQPLPCFIANSLSKYARDLGNVEGYSGYGPEQGKWELRNKISSRIYSNTIKPDEIFISDGAKCDIGRLQLLFGSREIAVQDPTYPVYVDGSVLNGVKKIVYMPCLPDNDFFPELDKISKTQLIYFCSPNNPTGAVASKQQLEELVAFAKRNQSLIIYDAAYAFFIKNPLYPKSIYEIEGAQEVAIEVNSFSKLAGFTGVRLGWTVVPEDLKYADGLSIKKDWSRLTTTLFNGASNIAQHGGCAILEDKGWEEVSYLIDYYLENASILKNALTSMQYEVFGGDNAPYLWIKFQGKKSWDIFQDLLENHHIITVPGVGFGKAGEGFIRISAFGNRESIFSAVERLIQRKECLSNFS